MTRDELTEFLLTTEAGGCLDGLIGILNSELQCAFVPSIFKGDSGGMDYISNWIYDKLCDLVIETGNILHKACPHHIPESLAHGGNIVCLACEKKCDNFVVF